MNDPAASRERTQCGIAQFLCWNEKAHAHYVALSMFCDLFGDRYTKPIYIETTPLTSNLEGECQKKQFMGRCYYSLIKNRSGVYRFNADIYRDAHLNLGLSWETEPNLAFGLMKTAKQEIKEAYSLSDALAEARCKNATVESAISSVLLHLATPESSLGLIGSLCIDPSLQARDVDLVFTGDVASLNEAHRWVREGAREGTPLRHYLPPPSSTICAFFSAQPIAYPDLSEFKVVEPAARAFDLLVRSPLSPTYLNVQIYSAQVTGENQTRILVIRDTLSRDGLKPGSRIELFGFPATVKGKQAILVTDVERQIPKLSFHGGGKPSNYLNGVKE